MLFRSTCFILGHLVAYHGAIYQAYNKYFEKKSLRLNLCCCIDVTSECEAIVDGSLLIRSSLV